jgi:hypothetical protein
VDRTAALSSVTESSPKLTVLAAAPVIAAELRSGAVMGILARQAQAYPRDGILARFWDLGSALGAVGQARTLGQSALRAANRILHGRVNLLLYSAFLCPTRSHISIPEYCR